MDNAFIPGLAKMRNEPASHSPVPISLLFPAYRQHLERNAWRSLGTALI